MSLHQLRTLRRGGRRPEQVTVIIGKPPKSFEDGADKVVIASDPARLDLSPLVGLPVHVLDLQADSSLTLRAIAALEAVNVRPLGICGPAGACGVSEDHEHAMASYRRALCPTA